MTTVQMCSVCTEKVEKLRRDSLLYYMHKTNHTVVNNTMVCISMNVRWLALKYLAVTSGI